jgi:uncharacterized repeat protein (TIGR01451 family)
MTLKKNIILIFIVILFLSSTIVQASEENQHQSSAPLKTLIQMKIQDLMNTIKNLLMKYLGNNTPNILPTCFPLPLHITMSDGLTENAYVLPNETITYTITYVNPSDTETYTDIIIEDVLPAQLIYKSTGDASWVYDPTDHMVFMHCADLPPNATKTITLNVTVNESMITEPMLLCNNISISTKNIVNTTSEYTNIFIEGYDPEMIHIYKDDNLADHILSLKDPSETTSINYTISLQNPTPIRMENITIKDIMPSYLSLINASPGLMNSAVPGNYYWMLSELFPYETVTFWIHTSVDPATEPGSYLSNTAAVFFMSKTNSTTTCTWVKENNPPTSTLSVGQPQYLKNTTTFITSDTPLTITATDNETYWTGVRNLTYIISNTYGTVSTTINDNDAADIDPRNGYITTTFTLEKDCLNAITFYAWDTFNNETIDDNIYGFQVINTPPTLDPTIGAPQEPCYYQIDGNCYPAISPITPLTIQTACTHSCQEYVDLEYLSIEIYHGDYYGGWELTDTYTIIDNDQQDTDPGNDTIEMILHLQENCWYQIHYWAEDKLGNRNPVQGHVLTKDVYVDAQGPAQDYWITGPQYTDTFKWITNQTVMHVSSQDLGCTDQGIGVNKTEWWLLQKQGNDWAETHRETIFDNQEEDTDTTPGEMTIEIKVDDDGEHYIYYQSTDALGNKGAVQKHYVRIDSQPPLSSLVIGQPSCDYYDDEEQIFCVTTDTKITIQSQDMPISCAVGLSYIEYEIYSYNQLIAKDKIYDTDHFDFFFAEECSHTLRYRSVDRLGNIEPWNSQLFKVDDHEPIIYLDVQEPTIQTNHHHPDYWVRTDTIIEINGQNQGSCPEWTIHYRINDGSWHDITDPLTRPYQFSFPDECEYKLEIEAYDCVGNTESVLKWFYVDDTAPEFHIIKPHNGVYSNGQTFHATYYAKDEASYSPPCYQNNAVGISDGHIAEAYFIDIRPHFIICPLNVQNLQYNLESYEYDGDIIIPDDCPILDGSAYFVSGVSDALGNGFESIKNQIQEYYTVYGPDSSQFNNLLQQLTTDKKIIEIVIDNTPPDGPDTQPPVVSIIDPQNNDIITSDILHICVDASDDKTETQNLLVQVQISISNYHQFIKTASYNPVTGFFELDFDVYCIKNNSQIEIQAFATDEAGRTGTSNLVSVTVRNTVYFSQWMDNGWNLIDFGYIHGNTSIPYVFGSLEEDYTIIFELSSESYFIYGQNFNTLHTVTPGQKYWVKMKQESGFYLNGD